jgi:hypothetical protein
LPREGRHWEDGRAVFAFRLDLAPAELDADLRSGLLLILNFVDDRLGKRGSGKAQG